MKFSQRVFVALAAFGYAAAATEVVAPNGEEVAAQASSNNNNMDKDDAEFWERFLGTDRTLYNYWYVDTNAIRPSGVGLIWHVVRDSFAVSYLVCSDYSQL